MLWDFTVLWPPEKGQNLKKNPRWREMALRALWPPEKGSNLRFSSLTRDGFHRVLTMGFLSSLAPWKMLKSKIFLANARWLSQSTYVLWDFAIEGNYVLRSPASIGTVLMRGRISCLDLIFHNYILRGSSPRNARWSPRQTPWEIWKSTFANLENWRLKPGSGVQSTCGYPDMSNCYIFCSKMVEI